MQAINRKIRNPAFFLALFGAPAASLAVWRRRWLCSGAAGVRR
jgi:uncharacterized membrane protein